MRRLALALGTILLLNGPALAQKPPAIELGFNANRVYDFGRVDNVNVYNGNVVINIPLGLRYPVASTISYGLTLTYNSKVWDHVTKPDTNDRQYTQSVPNRRSNAGAGWRVSMGRLLPPWDSTTTTYREEPERLEWMYEGSAGDEHPFHHDADDPVQVADNDIRMIKVSDVLRKVEFPDGQVHSFVWERNLWRLQTISDRFGNSVTVAYTYWSSSDNRVTRWTISDSLARSHEIVFSYENAMGDSIDRGMVVDRITLEGVAAAGGGRRTYVIDLNYTPTQVAYGCHHDYWQSDVLPEAPVIGTLTSLPLLTSIALPDGTSYEFSYLTADSPECSQALLHELTLPTRGKITYQYQRYELHEEACVPTGPQNSSPGVKTRSEDGSVWTYMLTQGPPVNAIGVAGRPLECGDGPDGDPLPVNAVRRWVRTSILSPADPQLIRTRQDHYFSAWSAPSGTDPNSTMKASDPNLFQKAEAASPAWPGAQLAMRTPPPEESGPDSVATDDNRPPDANNRSLAEQLWGDCTATGACGTLLRSTYRRFTTVDGGEREPTSTRIVYENDQGCQGTCWQQTNVSDYDGVGHFRRTVRSSNFPGINGDTIETAYVGWSSADKLNSNKKWALNRFTEQKRTVGDQTARKTFCFDEYGQLMRQRVLAGTTEQANDLVTAYSYISGNVLTESSYGGDGGAVGLSADLCSAALGTLAYKNRFEWSNGVLARSYYVNPASGGDLPFKSLDYTVDPGTGLVTASRAIDGVSTNYEYEIWGRLAAVRPAGRAWTKLSYSAATSVARARVDVEQYANGQSSGTALTTAAYEFDPLGRVVVQRTKLPGQTIGSESRRETAYDALGRQWTVSELGTSATLPVTKFQYDGLGRVKQIESPDASLTEFTLTGDRLKERTVFPEGTGSGVTTKEEYDVFGRLIKVTQKAGPTSATAPLGGDVTTEYSYDVGDRLTLVKMKDTGTAFQERVFDYDGRGFLRWESHPESGMTSYAYDARGHVKEKGHGAAFSQFDLQYQYDSAERLTKVSGRAPGGSGTTWRPVKEFSYAASNDLTVSPADLRMGKLATAIRYNYPLMDSGFWPDYLMASYRVVESYGYRDAAGRRTHRTTEITKRTSNTAPSAWDPLQTVEQSFAYNDLDLVQQTVYPKCMGCGTSSTGLDKQQQMTYSEGFATAVPGVVSSIDYWPNGMWKARTHANGVVDQQTVDSSGIARPASISSGPKTSCVAPVIVAQPQGQRVTSPNTPVTLTVTATGTATLKYQWYQCAPNGGCDVIAGATSSTYVAAPATSTEYYVEVTNACTTTMSSLTFVSVNTCEAPSIGVLDEWIKRHADGTVSIEVSASGAEPITVTWRRLSDNAVVGTGTKLVVGPLSVTTKYSATVSHQCSSQTDTETFTIEVPLPITATGLRAERVSGSEIRVTWPASLNANRYVVERRSGSTGWASVGETETLQYNDLSVAANTAYAYRVYALDAGGKSASRYSNADVAYTGTFSLVQANQSVAASHLDEARRALNAVRAAVGWPALTWSEMISAYHRVPDPQEVIRAAHVYTCRARMNEALQALGALTPVYTDLDLTGKKPKTAHINDILGAAQ